MQLSELTFFSFFLKSKFCKIFKYSRSQITMPKTPSNEQFKKIIKLIESECLINEKGFKTDKITKTINNKKLTYIDISNIYLYITKYYYLRANW